MWLPAGVPGLCIAGQGCVQDRTGAASGAFNIVAARGAFKIVEAKS